jgi:hypothetical protein
MTPSRNGCMIVERLRPVRLSQTVSYCPDGRPCRIHESVSTISNNASCRPGAVAMAAARSKGRRRGAGTRTNGVHTFDKSSCFILFGARGEDRQDFRIYSQILARICESTREPQGKTRGDFARPQNGMGRPLIQKEKSPCAARIAATGIKSLPRAGAHSSRCDAHADCAELRATASAWRFVRTTKAFICAPRGDRHKRRRAHCASYF